MPSARIEPAVERIKRTYADERIDCESFFSWARRQDAKYFHTLLADLIAVAAEDVPVVLRDHGDATDFRVLQLGGGECAGASQQKIGTLFFEAAHERNYRDALKFQRKYSEALSCADASLTAIARALGDATGVQADDLDGFVAKLSAIPETQSLAAELGELAAVVALEDAPGEPDISAVFTRIDAWIDSAADWCQQRDPALVLREALRPQARRFASATATA